MKICRVSAEWVSDPTYQFIVICGVDDKGKVTRDGEWYGCAIESDGGRYPFYVRPKSDFLCYGQGDIPPENTDLFRDATVAVGKTFTLRGQKEGGGFYVRKYLITHVDALTSPSAE